MRASSEIRPVPYVFGPATATAATRTQAAVLRGAATRARPAVRGTRVAGPRHQRRATRVVRRRRDHRSAGHGQDRVRLAARRAQLFRPSRIVDPLVLIATLNRIL